jgi:DNA-binding MarR family transcriptional regulator
LRRFQRPEEFGPYLDENAAQWEEFLGDADAGRALRLFGRLEALSRGWAALQREVLPSFGLNYAELTTLGTLHNTPSGVRSPGELRHLLGQSSAGMTRILDKLEDEHWVRRELRADDRRKVDVVLTRRGAKRAEAALGALLAVESELLSPLGKRRLEEVVSAFDVLHDALARSSE